MIRRFGPGLLALALVAADLIRPSLEPGVPVFQATLVGLAVALTWRTRLCDLREGGERWALLTLLAPDGERLVLVTVWHDASMATFALPLSPMVAGKDYTLVEVGTELRIASEELLA
ncbi:MAG TPA: hypothetical protein PLD86_10805, partial [Vicinamibacteria bacterium]|nr:hypothetical protein [Vicinamibacteria bacterium]